MKKFFQLSEHLSPEDIVFYTQMPDSDDKRAHNIEKHLIDCPLCSEAIEGLSAVNDFETVKANIKQTQNRLNEVIAPPAQSAPAIPSWGMNRVIRYVAAASIVLAIGTGVLLYQNRVAYEEKLYTENYRHYDDMRLVRRLKQTPNTPTDNDNLQNAMNIYSEGNYPAAIEAFHDYLKEDPGNPTANFYMGLSYLEEQSAKEAIEAIKTARLSPSKEDRIYIDAGWYLALAYLKDKNTTQCKTVLQEVINEHGDFAVDAQKLMKALGD